MINGIWQPLFLDLANSNSYAKFYQHMPKGYRDRASFTFFRIGTSANPLPMPNGILPNVIWNLFGVMMNCIWQSVCPDLVNSNVYAKVFQNIPNGSRDRTRFTFFRIWTSAKPWPIPNDIWHYLGLHFVNINVYAKYHNIPPTSRDRAILTFSEFGTRQNFDRW